MTRIGLLVLVAGLLPGAAPALAQAQVPPPPANLQLAADAVQTDPAGAFVNVRVKNIGNTLISQIQVGCQFLDNGKVVGSSDTTLYASVPGVTGIGQVRLFGATSATQARCGILKAS
ncbi:hypothetical protein GCM10007301_06380 [Azorhizobium oxalatiphilum]|uniref:Uncharacterized protein n=1 Tax=Azorhizobium oxalatiphilum TaxID=980631 RepID=A0A917BM35_9HYPH|nr:hypothetical protein [Azorhizobium oxalatiphilum]GGF49845.1 hypothetical protein GCM10007301_06380 [Azorhizobium oxalatiphilum]